MNKVFASIVLSLLLTTGMCFAQASASGEAKTLSQVQDRALSGVEKEFVSAADAMPDDKYDFAPTTGEFKGVRTFAMQVKHVAAVNYLVASTMLNEKSPVDIGGENGPDAMKSKADIVKFLKDSFAYSHKAVAATNEQNAVEAIKSPFGEGKSTRLGLSTLIVAHCFDHYGQMAVYLRMNGIIPPASRQ